MPTEFSLFSLCLPIFLVLLFLPQLDVNGFDTKGWVTKKKTKASILDKAKPSQNEPQGGGTVTLIAFTMVMLALLVATDALIFHLNSKDIFVQPLISWESALQETGHWVVKVAEGLLWNKTFDEKDRLVQPPISWESALHETRQWVFKVAECLVRNKMLMFDENSTSVPESVATIAENLVAITAEPKVVVDAATDLVKAAGAATTKVAEVVPKSISNNMTSNGTGIIIDAVNTSNSVWEEYTVVALFVCILLNWLAM